MLLSDVLDWRAVEVAHLLEISVGAVNSALHRARVTLEKNYPNVQTWYQGRDAIRRVLAAVLFPSSIQRQWRLLPTHANGQPAFVVYKANETKQIYRAFSVQVLTLDTSQFPGQVAAFGFPPQLP